MSDWFSKVIKLGDKSLGAVSVRKPLKRWGGNTVSWSKSKLSGYLSKYIGKDFDSTTKYAKKYWRSYNIEKHVVERFWLQSKTFVDAVREAHDIVYYNGAQRHLVCGESSQAGVIWITGETERALTSKTIQCEPELEYLFNFQF